MVSGTSGARFIVIGIRRIADLRLSPEKEVDSTLTRIALSSPKGDVQAPKAVL
jgi:hypothetical protein